MQDKDFDELLNNLNEKNLERYAKTHLSEKKQKRLNEILSDKSKLDEVLNSRQAKDIISKLKGRKNG